MDEPRAVDRDVLVRVRPADAVGALEHMSTLSTAMPRTVFCANDSMRARAGVHFFHLPSTRASKAVSSIPGLRDEPGPTLTGRLLLRPHRGPVQHRVVLEAGVLEPALDAGEHALGSGTRRGQPVGLREPAVHEQPGVEILPATLRPG